MCCFVLVCVSYRDEPREFCLGCKKIMSSSDYMTKLPINSAQTPSAQDLRVMEAMFGNTPSSAKSTLKLIVPGILFFILSMPFIDKFLRDKITASNLVLLVIKTGLFLAILIIAQLFGLA